MLIFVIYDISDTPTRNRLIKCLQHFGMRRVQKSAFLGNLSQSQREGLEKYLDSYITGEKDSIYVIPLCDRCQELSRIFSKPDLELENRDNFRIL